MPKAECVIRVAGNSMTPNYPSGCLIGLRKISDGLFDYGAVYVIETEDNRFVKAEAIRAIIKPVFCFIRFDVNYPFAKDKWASGFKDLCFFAESPPVFSTVPAEFNIFNPSFRMFFAALRSRSNTCPFLQVHSLIERFKS